MTDKIAEIFDITPMEKTEVSIIENEEVSSDEMDSIEETTEVQDNIRDAIVQTKDVLEEIIVLAKTSEQPRAYEVAATMIKTLLEANRDLLSAAKYKHEIKHGKGAKSPATGAMTNITNSNVVVTTAELLNKLKGNQDD